MIDLISRTSVGDWKYVAEGGSTIVFSYDGHPYPVLTGKVLRLRKIALKTSDVSAPAAALPVGNFDDPTIAFQQTVIHRLVPEDFLPQLHVVKVDKEWLRLLAEVVEPSRPEARRVVDRIDLDMETAVLADNLIGGSDLAVEIKPKWGFLPCPDHLSSATRPIKTRTCRFCMHAHLKGAAEEDVPSNFCPLDLYSGDEHRVGLALRALWDAWVRTDGGINNLRVFAKGRILKPSSDVALLGSLLTSTATPNLALDELRAQFVEALLPTLLATPVFHLLSFRQRTLDPLDIEGLAALWARIYAHDQSSAPLAFGEHAVEPTLEEWASFVDAYLARCQAYAGSHKGGPVAQHTELRYYCLAYLLSATFKDCSIILRFGSAGQVDERAHKGQQNASPLAAQAEVKIIDLDIKSIKRLTKWEKTDKEIVDAYVRVEAPRTCVDALAGVHVA
ncbi:hypothetical protein DAEQUDRAFT_765100 [Daedalea quercina L-15889]|uniref:Inositol-pentakisphosphate 2-kinase n=1 Tax=Daedalea quercina L-15889 TaxID=1314783 RepID=A0A165QQ26_9APHY|nr:hypothetical protein DAEQUDRAFT_765100 [Daedalea quercina L-15889]